MVPLLNLICVLVLARYAADESPEARTTAGMVLRNPLIWSVLAGIALNVSDVPLPPIAVSFAEILGQGALALGLLAVGAGLELGKVLRPSAAAIVTIVVKLAVMPATAISLALWFGLDGAALTIVAVGVLPNAELTRAALRARPGHAG